MVPWLKLVATFLPVVLQVVQAVEQALENHPGDVKKAVAMAVINPPVDQAPDVSKLVDVTVGALNQAKVFQKSAPPAGLGTAGS